MMDLSQHTSQQLERWAALAFGQVQGTRAEVMDAKAQVSRMIGLGAFVPPKPGVRALLGRADVAASGLRACANDPYFASRRAEYRVPGTSAPSAPSRPSNTVDYGAVGAPRVAPEPTVQDVFRTSLKLGWQLHERGGGQ